MKWIKYQIKIEHDTDGDGAPDITTLTEKTVEYSDSAYQLALAEAYQGQVTIEDDGKPEPAPTQLDRIEAQTTYTAMMTDTLLEG